MRECFCFGSEAVNASGEAVRGLVKSRVGNSLAASPLANSSRASPDRNIAALPPLARSRIPPATQATLVLVVLNHIVNFAFWLSFVKSYHNVGQILTIYVT